MDCRNTSPTAALAQLGQALRYAELPEDVRTIARHSLLDWLSVLLAGWSDPAVQILVAQATERGARPRATLLGSAERLDLVDAALINGTASHVLDFDDAHLASRVHASVVLWPAVVAVGEHRASSGREALTAFVAGLEVQARIAELVGNDHYRRGWHNTATLGSFGATLAAGRLFELEGGTLRHALGLAATLTGGLRAVFGTPCKPLHAGRAAANGITAADLARRGFTAVEDILERPDGYPALVSGNARQELPDTAGRWATRELLFKYHASCYGTQAPVEAALALRAALGGNIPAGELSVEVEPQYLSVCNLPEPRTAMEARFSIRHMVALALAGRSTVDERSFSAAALADPQLTTLRQHLHVAADPALPRAHARLKAGPNLEFGVDASRPEHDPLEQRRRLCAKSAQLLAGRLEAVAIDELQALALAVDTFDDLGQWTGALRRLVRSATVRFSHAEEFH
ncbi:2-methylcitrate dehydratase PrpD [Azotobacter beijerinckii]|uniref:2-methylcitrate dehydratase PrpD n=1 Tax=Azotobacter beijerinckii TaxID=170623 RepID=A0A1H6VCH5_9GAMM|nr:MmgE/PrpD family protein [Azotobacter beijerinckii]SEJ00694.1 2-methylcitrate dehydratase PrpD [Azotobacter beijerinckii]